MHFEVEWYRWRPYPCPQVFTLSVLNRFAQNAPMIAQFTILIIGFTIFSAFILAGAYVFFLKTMRKTKVGVDYWCCLADCY